jgi:polygalacturonase
MAAITKARTATIKMSLTACAFAGISIGAQDTRHVSEPKIPPVCATLSANLTYRNDRLLEGDAAPLNTQAIQHALDRCKPGHAVKLAASGAHNALLTGPLELHTGVTLVIDRSVHLVASNNPQDYERLPGSCGLTEAKAGGCRPLISIIHADHAGIMGKGIIEGRGDQPMHGAQLTWWQMHQMQGDVHHNIPWLIGTQAANDFTLYGITLRMAPNFNVFLDGGNGITVWGVTIDAPWDSPNTDGIDPSGCTNVTITHSFIRNGDDGVAIKAPSDKPSSHITVSDDHFYEGHGMSIGSGTEGGISAVRFSHITIDHQKAGIHIKSNPGHGGQVHDIIYDDLCIRDTATPIDLESTYIDANAPRQQWANGTAFPDYTGIVLHDVHTEGGSRLRLMGIDVSHRIEVQFDGVSIRGMENIAQRSAHASVTLGPGSSNWVPSGEDVSVEGIPKVPSGMTCSDRFVPFPPLQ